MLIAQALFITPAPLGIRKPLYLSSAVVACGTAPRIVVGIHPVFFWFPWSVDGKGCEMVCVGVRGKVRTQGFFDQTSHVRQLRFVFHGRWSGGTHGLVDVTLCVALYFGVEQHRLHESVQCA